MQVARVVGDVVATMKDANLTGHKLLVLQPFSPSREGPLGRHAERSAPVGFAGDETSAETPCGGSVQPIVLEGQPELLPRDQPTVEVRQAMPGYLRTMRIPLVAGRDVSASDVEVMLVSRSAAKLLWGDVSPIGRRVTLPLMSRTVQREVVGVVGDVKQGLAGRARRTHRLQLHQ